jgi:hypothetical protein
LQPREFKEMVKIVTIQQNDLNFGRNKTSIPDCVVYNKLDIYVFIMIAYSEIDDTFPHKYTPYSIFYDVTEVLSLVDFH